MRQSIIPSISLKNNETLTMTPGQAGWFFTLTAYTAMSFGALTKKRFLSNETLTDEKHLASMLGYMVNRMRRDIEQEVLRQVLGERE